MDMVIRRRKRHRRNRLFRLIMGMEMKPKRRMAFNDDFDGTVVLRKVEDNSYCEVIPFRQKDCGNLLL